MFIVLTSRINTHTGIQMIFLLINISSILKHCLIGVFQAASKYLIRYLKNNIIMREKITNSIYYDIIKMIICFNLYNLTYILH